MNQRRGAPRGLFGLVLLTAGCDLNPQPLPPDQSFSSNSGNQGPSRGSGEEGGLAAGSVAADASALPIPRVYDASVSDAPSPDATPLDARPSDGGASDGGLDATN